jgi:hypothetical protein
VLFATHRYGYFATDIDRSIFIFCIDHFGTQYNPLELLDATLDKGQLFFGRMILGVLGEIAKVTGAGYALDRGSELGTLELCQLCLDLSETSERELDFVV